MVQGSGNALDAYWPASVPTGYSAPVHPPPFHQGAASGGSSTVVTAHAFPSSGPLPFPTKSTSINNPTYDEPNPNNPFQQMQLPPQMQQKLYHSTLTGGHQVPLHAASAYAADYTGAAAFGPPVQRNWHPSWTGAAGAQQHATAPQHAQRVMTNGGELVAYGSAGSDMLRMQSMHSMQSAGANGVLGSGNGALGSGNGGGGNAFMVARGAPGSQVGTQLVPVAGTMRVRQAAPPPPTKDATQFSDLNPVRASAVTLE